MKKIIIGLALMCLFILFSFTGCTAKRPILNIYYIAENCITSKVIEEKWESQISEEFNMNIDIHYISINLNDNHNHNEVSCSDQNCSNDVSKHEMHFDYVAFKKASELDGLVYTTDYRILNKLIQLDFIKPVKKTGAITIIQKLTDYPSYDYYNNWIIPISCTDSPVFRFYNKEFFVENQ